MNFGIIVFISFAGLATSFLFRREIRFSEVSAQFNNKSVGEVIDFSMKQHRGQHQLTVYLIRHIPTSPDAMMIDIIKCKEYYLDCVNYHSWTLKDFCNATESYMMFVNVHQSNMNSLKCPLKGELVIRNFTVNADLLMSTLSNSVTEPWWEYYWITKGTMITADQRRYLTVELKFYILSVSTFQRKRNQNR